MHALGFQSFPRISFREATCYNTHNRRRPANVSCVKSASGTYRANANVPGAWEETSAQIPRHHRGWCLHSRPPRRRRRNEGPRSLSLVRSFCVTVRVFRGRRGLARDIGSRGTDNLVLTDRWTTLIQDPGPAHLIDTDKPIILFRIFRTLVFSYMVYELI